MNNISTLAVIALASWIVLPALATVLALFSISGTFVAAAAGIGSALAFTFETSRDWILDLLV